MRRAAIGGIKDDVQVAGETGGAPARVEPGRVMASAAAPSRPARVAPPHLRPLAELDDRPALETRLPLLILLGLGLLVGVQVVLAL